MQKRQQYLPTTVVNLFLSDLLSHENAETLNDVKTLVQQLYTTLCIEQHQLNKERELVERLENLKQQLAPLEKVRTPQTSPSIFCVSSPQPQYIGVSVSHFEIFESTYQIGPLAYWSEPYKRSDQSQKRTYKGIVWSLGNRPRAQRSKTRATTDQKSF